jgi:hypothetical protein
MFFEKKGIKTMLTRDILKRTIVKVAKAKRAKSNLSSTG